MAWDTPARQPGSAALAHRPWQASDSVPAKSGQEPSLMSHRLLRPFSIDNLIKSSVKLLVLLVLQIFFCNSYRWELQVHTSIHLTESYNLEGIPSSVRV